MGNYYDCRLTLSPAVDPVCCPSGFVFSREAIIENLLEQKKANKRKLAAWEAQQAEEARKAAGKAAIEQEAALLAFDRQNHAGASKELATKLHEAVSTEAEALMAEKRTATGVVNIRDNEQMMKTMKAFWVPSQTPEAVTRVEKPDGHTLCPASGKKLKLKDLIPITFTPVPGGEPHEFMDPVMRTPLTNASRLVVLKPTGAVMLEETWRRCIRPEGEYEGKRVCDDDVLELQRGGTGFAEHDKEALQAKRYFALGPGSGLADLRGQTSRGGSKFGLAFTN